MEIVSTLRELWHRKLALLLIGVVALGAALLSAYKLPSFEKRSVEMGSASSQILVDSPNSTLVAGTSSVALGTLATRAKVYAQYLSSRDARSKISRASGIPAAQIASNGPFSADTGRMNYEPQPAEARANDILKEKGKYRIVFIAQQDVPIITVSALGPDARSAIRLAAGSVTALKEYVASLADCAGNAANCVPRSSSGVVVRELGAAEGGTIGGGNGKLLMIFVFLAVMGLGCLFLAVLPGIARQWRQLDWADGMAKEFRPDQPEPAVTEGADQKRRRLSRRGRAGGSPTDPAVEASASEDLGERTASVVP